MSGTVDIYYTPSTTYAPAPTSTIDRTSECSTRQAGGRPLSTGSQTSKSTAYQPRGRRPSIVSQDSPLPSGMLAWSARGCTIEVGGGNRTEKKMLASRSLSPQLLGRPNTVRVSDPRRLREPLESSLSSGDKRFSGSDTASKAGSF